MSHEHGGAQLRGDLDWDDEGILPPVLSPDTEFVFRRMTEETLKAAGVEPDRRALDVGCGRAIDAAALARNGGALFGCEPSRIMLRKAREGLAKNGDRVRLVGSLAETLPFAGHSFHRVVISVANYESLSCFLSRCLNRFVQRVWRREIRRPHIWEVPRDHTFKFDYPTILSLTQKYLRLECIRGVSLLWGFPRWACLLQRIPPAMALILLRGLDKIANWVPDWSDVLILVGRPHESLPEKERSS
jgi:SAM-dependent methyltransferase